MSVETEYLKWLISLKPEFLNYELKIESNEFPESFLSRSFYVKIFIICSRLEYNSVLLEELLPSFFYLQRNFVLGVFSVAAFGVCQHGETVLRSVTQEITHE